MRKVVVLLTLLFSLLIFNSTAFSVECQSTTSQDPETLQEIINACNSKLGELSEQRNTLASQIEYMDTQISVTQLEINRNLGEIERLKKEIKNLSSRITELNSTTDKISDTIKLKIEQMYKRQQTGLIYTLMGANNLPKFLRSIQYLRRSQISDRELLLKLQNTKVTFEEQKDLRKVKENELNQLTASLENYKIDLASQQQAKEQLLRETQNDEVKYQQILSRAKAQIQAFKSFVSSSGAGGIISANGLGVGYDGTYYSQRDERWANNTIGASGESIGNVGCLVTSVAMVLKSKGVDVTPTDIAANNCYFDLCTTAYMKFSIDLPGGHRRASSHVGNISFSDINSKLDSGEPVIVGLNAGSYGTHFIVLKKKDGDSWIMYDPVYGPDIKFTDHYDQSQIFSQEIIY